MHSILTVENSLEMQVAYLEELYDINNIAALDIATYTASNISNVCSTKAIHLKNTRVYLPDMNCNKRNA